MFKILRRHRSLAVLFISGVAIKIFSANETWVEHYYSLGLYPFLSKVLRGIFGWVPFSVGDVCYVAVALWIILKLVKLISNIVKRKAGGYMSWNTAARALKFCLVVYLVFSLIWGLNYYRHGIAKQTNIELQVYTKQDLAELTMILSDRVNFFAGKTDSMQRLYYNHHTRLFDSCLAAYSNIKKQFPFLRYSPPSTKVSLFSPIGQYIGFTGYYNPFSGEAQLKTSIPVFLKPFVMTHEIAHQLGYAKENEASFVAFLTCRNSGNPFFMYAAYFDVYREALYDGLKNGDSVMVVQFRKNLSETVRTDFLEMQRYVASTENFLEPLMSGAYDKYLKLNNQPKGKATYNEVIAYLVAYMKKFGKQAI